MEATNRNNTFPNDRDNPVPAAEEGGGDLEGPILESILPEGELSPFEVLAAKLPIPLVWMRPDGTVTYTNREAASVTGYAVEEMLGRPFWLEVIHPEDRHRLTQTLRKAGTHGQAETSVRFQAQDGTMRRVDVYLQPVGEGDEVGGALLDVTEQDEVAAALHQSEMLYQTFLEQSPVGIAHLDAEGVVTFESHQLRTITGEDADAAWIGRALHDIERLDPRLPPLVAQMLAQGGAFAGEDFVVLRSEGKRRIAQVYGAAIQHPEDGIVGGVLMLFDITEEHEREAELRVLRRYDEAGLALRDAALSASAPHAFLDEAMRVLGATARADLALALLQDKSGEDYEEQARWSRYADLPTRKVQVSAPAWEALVRREASVGEVEALSELLGDGEAILLPFATDKEQAGGLVLARIDPAAELWSDAERNALGNLRVLFETLWNWMLVEARYRQVVSSVEDSLFSFSFDEEGERAYSFATRQMEAITGYSTDELLAGGLSWRDQVVFEEDREAVAKHEQTLKDEHESRLVYRIRTAQGGIRWLRESATPGRDRSGHVVAGILSDVTEAKEAEATLIQAKQDAESATRMKSTFLATMSHEIRTPLGAISGFADLLMEEVAEMGDAPPVVTEFASTIRTSTKNVLRLVNDLFDLASLQSGRIYVDRAPVALDPVLTQVARTHEGTLDERGVGLVLDLAPGDPIVLGEAKRLAQVAEHLVSNAVKFTEEGEVRIATTLTDTDARLVVADTGIGIAPDYFDELFEPFSQGDNRLNRNYEGSGLGLAIVKRLVGAMNGTIDVKSTQGEGTTVTVTLPRADG
jgi:PAS domain S-box-containing protein